MPALRTVYGWELRKLVAQKRTYLGLGAAALVPVIFVVALGLQSGQPEDVPFGRYVRQSGLAIPPVILIFGSYWLFPLITALVSGDIVAAEDHNGTLKTILTRSVGRGRIFAAKVLASLTYAVVALATMGLTAVIGGVIASGFHPLVTLSGTTVSASRALLLIGASLLVYLLPLAAVAAIAPPTEMCGSDARLCRATPSGPRAPASSAYVRPAASVTVLDAWSTETSAGRPSSASSSDESPMSLNECRAPTTRTRGARATISRTSSSVDGRCTRSARYVWLPPQFVSCTGITIPRMLPGRPPARAAVINRPRRRGAGS